MASPNLNRKDRDLLEAPTLFCFYYSALIYLDQTRVLLAQVRTLHSKGRLPTIVLMMAPWHIFF
jgi:hypothetical protein